MPELSAEKPDRQYKHVRSIERGLAILDTIARHENSSTAQISTYSGVPRTSVYRILETLEDLGYVRRSDEGKYFHLTSKLRLMGSRHDGVSVIGELAFPAMKQLVRKVWWPSSLSLIDHDAMRIVESTHHLSPHSVHRNAIGTRLPLLTTGSGRAYICFCGKTERQALLKNVAKHYDANTMERNLERLHHVQQEAERDGFASSNGDTDPRFASIALPVRQSDQVVAALNLIFFRKTMKIKTAVTKFLPKLTYAVENIEAEIALNQFDAMRLQSSERASLPDNPGMLPKMRDRTTAALPSEH